MARDQVDSSIASALPRIESMFGRLKDWRGIAMRYTRCGDLFLSAIALAASVIFWLR